MVHEARRLFESRRVAIQTLHDLLVTKSRLLDIEMVIRNLEACKREHLWSIAAKEGVNRESGEAMRELERRAKRDETTLFEWTPSRKFQQITEDYWSLESDPASSHREKIKVPYRFWGRHI